MMTMMEWMILLMIKILHISADFDISLSLSLSHNKKRSKKIVCYCVCLKACATQKINIFFFFWVFVLPDDMSCERIDDLRENVDEVLIQMTQRKCLSLQSMSHRCAWPTVTFCGLYRLLGFTPPVVARFKLPIQLSAELNEMPQNPLFVTITSFSPLRSQDSVNIIWKQ